MSWFNNLKVALKLAILGIGSIMMLFLIGIMEFLSINHVTNSLDEMYHQ